MMLLLFSVWFSGLQGDSTVIYVVLSIVAQGLELEA